MAIHIGQISSPIFPCSDHCKKWMKNPRANILNVTMSWGITMTLTYEDDEHRIWIVAPVYGALFFVLSSKCLITYGAFHGMHCLILHTHTRKYFRIRQTANRTEWPSDRFIPLSILVALMRI